MLWQRSPQYQNMPYQQYMQTAEGQRSRQAFQRWEDWQQRIDNRTPEEQDEWYRRTGVAKTVSANARPNAAPRPQDPSVTMRSWQSSADQNGNITRKFLDGKQEQENYSRPQQNAPQQSYKPRLINPSQVTMAGAPQRDTPYTKPDMSRYSPGRAQPIQPQSQGTRYGQPQQPQRIPYGRPQTPQQPGSGAWWDQMPMNPTRPSPAPAAQPGVGGFAPSGPQASPFSAVTYGFDGTSMEPAQFIGQRDALIQLLNDDNARYQMQSGVGPRPGAAPQSPDIASLWGQAGDMVNDGWRNPLTGGAPMGRMNSNFAGQPRSPQMQGMASQGWMF